jgi:hypothetical protein
VKLLLILKDFWIAPVCLLSEFTKIADSEFGSVPTGQVFFLFDPEAGTFNNYYDDTGLITDLLLITGIVEDESKLLWLYTDIGFIRLDPETKNAALFGKSWKKPSQTGFYSLNTFISKNNEIFVGNATGYFSFRPADLEKQYPTGPTPYLSAFFLRDRTISSQTDKKNPAEASQ